MSKEDVIKEMAAPYSLDLRRKVVRACQRQGQSQRAVAEFFGVSLSLVKGLLRRVRRSGELVPPRRRPGRHAKVDPMGCQRLQHWLQEQPDLTLAELAGRLHTEGSAAVSAPTLCRVLQRLGLRRKKKTLHASERDTAQVRQARGQYWQDIARHPPSRLKFVD